ncbi:hypothetical protein N7451_003732 [Penicillium sp. IBT 35674x]|nr:hypothetical protein N7451_003732 [Penicillium sp. IBT 35674x]
MTIDVIFIMGTMQATICRITALKAVTHASAEYKMARTNSFGIGPSIANPINKSYDNDTKRLISHGRLSNISKIIAVGR